MNTKSKVVLTAVMLTTVLSFTPNMARAEKMEGSHGMMMEEEGQGSSKVAIHGFCPVCVINGMKVKGSDNFTTEYKGKVYKFPSIEQQRIFLADPEKYVADLDAKFMALKEKSNEKMMEGSH